MISKRYLNLRINFSFEKIDYEKADLIFSGYSKILAEIEVIRKNFAGRWCNLIAKTGAITLRNPLFTSCIEGLYWKLAADNEHIENLKLYLKEPFYEFESSEDNKPILEAYKIFLEYYQNNIKAKDELQSIKNMRIQYKQILDKFKDEKKFYEGTKFTKEQKKLINHSIENNLKKIYHAHIACLRMNEIIRSICEKGQPCIDKSKQGKSINKALEIGEKSRKMKLSNSTHIVWEFSSEPKLRTYNEYLEIIQENNLNNRDHMVHYVDVKEDKPTTNVKVIKRSTMKLEGIAENQNPNEQSKNYLEKNHDKKEIENQLQLIKMKILDKEKTIESYESKIEETNAKIQKLESSEMHDIKCTQFNFILDVFPIYMYNPIPLKSNKFALKSTSKIENEIPIPLIIYIHDLDYVALADNQGNILIYRVRGMKLIKKFDVHKVKVKCFTYLCNGKNIISGDYEGKLILYSVIEPFDHMVIMEDLNSINDIVYCMDAHSIYVASNDKILKINFLNKKIICTIDGLPNEITRLIYHVKHKLLYSSCGSGIVICWDTDLNVEMKRIEDASIISDPILDMTIFPNLHSSQNEMTLERYYSKIRNFINMKSGYDELLIILSEVDFGQKSNILIFKNSDFSLIKKIENYRNYAKLISTFDGDTVIMPVKNSRDNSGIFITKNICNEIEKERSSNYNNSIKVEYLNGCYLGDGSRLMMVTSTGSIELWITI